MSVNQNAGTDNVTLDYVGGSIFGFIIEVCPWGDLVGSEQDFDHRHLLLPRPRGPARGRATHAAPVALVHVTN